MKNLQIKNCWAGDSLIRKHNIFTFPNLINLFAAYSFMGWIYELILKNFGKNSVINSVTNYGPFKTYYGIIGIIITIIFYYVLLPRLRRKSIIKIAVLGLFLAVFSSFIINFITTLSLEKALNIKVWDLNKTGKENMMVYYNMLSGLKYGLLAAFSFIFIYPGVTGLIMRMSKKTAKIQSIALACIMFGDIIISFFTRFSPYIQKLAEMVK